MNILDKLFDVLGITPADILEFIVVLILGAIFIVVPLVFFRLLDGHCI